MSFKTTEGKFKCEKCHAYFIEEDEQFCANCAPARPARKSKNEDED